MISGMPKNKKQDPDFKPGATNNTYRSTYNKDTWSTAAQLQGIYSLRCELRTHMGNVTKRVLHVLYRSVYTAVWTRNEMCKDFFAKTSLTFLTFWPRPSLTPPSQPGQIILVQNDSHILYYMFYVQLAPLGGILGPLKSDLGLFWPFRAIYSRYLIFTKSSFKVWLMDG